MDISIVVPIYNEQENSKLVYGAIRSAVTPCFKQNSRVLSKEFDISQIIEKYECVMEKVLVKFNQFEYFPKIRDC